jgi:16S rRNA (guanine966-N2)-methyltransferase
VTRIVAGFAGSLSLAVPKSGTRPTSDRVREAVFSALEAMDAVHGARVLDLYAGSGALALEAMSRGAASAVLVERSAQAAAVCRANAAALSRAAGRSGGGAELPRVEVRAVGVLSHLAGGAGSTPKTDLVFLDPPYEVTEHDLGEVLTALVPRLSPHAVVVVERSARSPEPVWPGGLELFRSKRYGETAVWFAQPAAYDVGAAEPEPSHPE